MGKNTAIEWTDHTFNVWRGCSHALLDNGDEHPGCINCYAESMSRMNPRLLGRWGTDGTRVLAGDDKWDEVRHWDITAGQKNRRDKVFVSSFGDICEHWDGQLVDFKGNPLCVSVVDSLNLYVIDPTYARGSEAAKLNDARKKLVHLVEGCSNLDFQFLTKRPGNYFGCFGSKFGRNNVENVWLGCSVSDQRTADELLPKLIANRRLVKYLFVSFEPALGDVHFDAYIKDLDWIICGYESGWRARMHDPRIVRSCRDQCVKAGVPFFFKQWGEFNQKGDRVGKFIAGRSLDGRTWSEFPSARIVAGDEAVPAAGAV